MCTETLTRADLRWGMVWDAKFKGLNYNLRTFAIGELEMWWTLLVVPNLVHLGHPQTVSLERMSVNKWKTRRTYQSGNLYILRKNRGVCTMHTHLHIVTHITVLNCKEEWLVCAVHTSLHTVTHTSSAQNNCMPMCLVHRGKHGEAHSGETSPMITQNYLKVCPTRPSPNANPNIHKKMSIKG